MFVCSVCMHLYRMQIYWTPKTQNIHLCTLICGCLHVLVCAFVLCRPHMLVYAYVAGCSVCVSVCAVTDGPLITLIAWLPVDLACPDVGSDLAILWPQREQPGSVYCVCMRVNWRSKFNTFPHFPYVLLQNKKQ